MKEKKKRNDLRAQLERLGYGRDSGGRRVRNISTDEIRRAVKKTARPDEAAPQEQQLLYRRDIPRQPVRRNLPRRRKGRIVALEEAVDGAEIRHTAGAGFLVSTRADKVDLAEAVSSRFRDLISTDGSALSARIARVCDPAGISHDDVLFLDIETTGLCNSPLFLIGIMVWEGDAFEVRQFFARNYAEEAAVISLFQEACAAKKLLVTFNGKTFDVPYIRARAAANGIPCTAIRHHLDMLHVCRRIWRRRLPDCKLQTLESFICKRFRHGDIPGSEIPDAYHRYVRTNDAWQMVDVLKHNMLDLITMADLMNRFPPVR